MKSILVGLFLLYISLLGLTTLSHSKLVSAFPQGSFPVSSSSSLNAHAPSAVSSSPKADTSSAPEIGSTRHSTLKAWPSRPFAQVIPAPPPWHCVLIFQNLGSIDGTLLQTTSLLSHITVQVEHLKAQRPGSIAFPFSETRWGVHFELQMEEPTSLTIEVINGALHVLDHYVRVYGARDVSPQIMCSGVLSGTFHISFVDSEQGAALISLPSNVSLKGPDLTA